LLIGTLGAAIALRCISTFVVIGRGTPAPFDPPRRLVVRGPYRFVRNPMYIGAALALAGAALFYNSVTLLAYSCVFLVATHLFVIGYEEPTLRRKFGSDYDDYRRNVCRWLPRFRASSSLRSGIPPLRSKRSYCLRVNGRLACSALRAALSAYP
jgi:protein-S-isoprenylcysteine O-methyltransferase Ste14